MIVSVFSIKFFSEGIYYDKKAKLLDEYASKIDEAIEEGNEDLQTLISEFSWEIGGMIYISDESGNIVLFSEKQGFGKGRGNGNSTGFITLRNSDDIIKRETGSGKEVLDYQRNFSNGDHLIIEIPVQDIGNTLDVVYNIFFYIFIISLIISFFGSLIISRHFTEPIRKLTGIAEKMRNLNFSEEYQEDRNDEIGILGKSLNALSRNLSYNIEKLSEELEKEKSLDKLRKQFVAQVSHELQTPLTIISGYMEALEDGIFSSEEEMKEYYATIHDEINGMSKMVKNLLDLSQLTSGKFSINRTKYIINDSLESIAANFYMLGDKENVKFQYVDPEKKFSVYADTIRIEQVINNILNNGFKHVTPGGHVVLKLIENDDTLEISVFNQGEKIAEKEMEHIWNAFYKIEKNNEKKGTGLGLSINREILNLHDFKYGIRNKDNGVEFYLIMNKAI